MRPAAYEPSKPAFGVSLAPGPLFVVAMWRGGSSLLYALLNKHPQVALTFEADLWLLRSVFRKPAAYCDWAARWEFWNSALTRHGITASDLPGGVADYATAFTAVHRAYAARKGAVIWGDKSPVYSDSLPELARLFPQARFIIQWRDPAATANAIARAAQAGFKRPGAYLRGIIGYQVLKSGVDFLLSRGQPVCQVTYEELTSDTAKVMEQVCRFLEIPYLGELADLRGADRSAILTDLPSAHHSLLRGDEIVRTPRPVILDQAVRQKINGYVNLWKRRYDGQWPPSVLADADDVALPRLSERIGDQVAYRAVRVFEQFRHVCYSYAPLAVLQSYRNQRRNLSTSSQ
jgi:hypothetical protein